MNASESRNELDDALAELKESWRQATPSTELKASTASAMSRQAAQSCRRRRQMRYAAVAAGFLVLVGAAIILFWGNSTPTFAQVVQQVEKTTTLQGKTDEPPMSHGLAFYIKGKLERWEQDNPWGPGRTTLIVNRNSNERFLIMPEHKTVQRDPGTLGVARDLYTVIREVAENPIEQLGTKQIDGRTLIGYVGSLKEKQPNGVGTTRPVRVWVDPKTKLPVRLEFVDSIKNQVVGALFDLRFDEPIDDALFAMTVPDGFRVNDNRQRVIPKRNPPPTAELARRLVLHPGVGIADVKVGDPASKLVALLGEPEMKEGYGVDGKEQEYKYLSLGLRIDFGWENVPEDWSKLKIEDQRLRKIFADSDVTGSPPQDFAGATDRGVRIGTARKEVEAIYGKPAWENMNNGDYRKLGMAVFYGGDGSKVSGFLILKPKDEPIFFLENEKDLPKPATTTTAPAAR